jgi:hypothetical protein
LAYKLTDAQSFVAGMILLISQVHKIASPFQGLTEFLSPNLLAVQAM